MQITYTLDRFKKFIKEATALQHSFTGITEELFPHTNGCLVHTESLYISDKELHKVLIDEYGTVRYLDYKFQFLKTTILVPTFHDSRDTSN